MAATNPTRVSVVLGCMEFGRRVDEDGAREMVRVFLDRGFDELDAAYMYQGGKTETFMGRMVADGTTFKYATKANPFGKNNLKANSVKSQLGVSLQRMQSNSADIFYLHAPDHTTDIMETLTAVQELYQQGKFVEFGLSNYAAWQVVEIYYLCKENNFILPTVYQGMYNPFTRDVERELLKACQRLGIRFYAYNPLAGGILSGKHNFSDLEQDTVQMGRFNKAQGWGTAYQNRFWKESYFNAVELVKEALVGEYGSLETCSVVEASLRFMVHHMKLTGEAGDAIILGASSMNHFEENLNALEGDPLPESVVNAFNQGWELTRADAPVYFR